MPKIVDRGAGIVGDVYAPEPSPPETFERPPQNGTYQGRVPVRKLPPAGSPGSTVGIAIDWQSQHRRTWKEAARRKRERGSQKSAGGTRVAGKTSGRAGSRAPVAVDPDEAAPAEPLTEEEDGMASKKGQVHRCSKCGEPGHKAPGCKNAAKPGGTKPESVGRSVGRSVGPSARPARGPETERVMSITVPARVRIQVKERPGGVDVSIDVEGA